MTFNIQIYKKNIVDVSVFPVILSIKAINAIEQALKNSKRINKILRISIEGGGCKGFKYNLNFIHQNQIDEYDILCQYNSNIGLVLDPNSYICLKNTIVDFVSIQNKSGFVFNNPNINAECNGCD